MIECNNDFDTVFEKHLGKIERMDINQLELVVIQGVLFNTPSKMMLTVRILM